MVRLLVGDGDAGKGSVLQHQPAQETGSAGKEAWAEGLPYPPGFHQVCKDCEEITVSSVQNLCPLAQRL